ncbi:hypothetical protein LXL04_028226 [Taraxacum kok-saghyz]
MLKDYYDSIERIQNNIDLEECNNNPVTLIVDYLIMATGNAGVWNTETETASRAGGVDCCGRRLATVLREGFGPVLDWAAEEGGSSLIGFGANLAISNSLQTLKNKQSFLTYCRRLVHLFCCRELQMWSADCRYFNFKKTNITLAIQFQSYDFMNSKAYLRWVNQFYYGMTRGVRYCLLLSVVM